MPQIASSTSRIQVLPDLLVRKIAAGEVIERPASVVKELLDNALDAGATRIALAFEDGGRQLIRVTDDGGGMTPDELPLAVAPHATSKLRAEEDLYAISSLGFRGEALASISAVSHLRIVSRTADAIEGHEVRVSAEQIEYAQAVGCPPGTTVEVRDLFFNVPARRKFLRGAATETGHINEQVARASLAYPGIEFEVTNNKRVTHRLPACANRLERIGHFFGPEVATDLMTIERDERGVRLELYAAPPQQSRATPQWQYTFVNGRYIRDRFLQHAIREAYRGLMEPSRSPVVFLFIAIEPDRVDVNVHPTKIEVRWADSHLIHSQVFSALRETLQRHDLTHTLRVRAPAPVDPAEQERLLRETAEMFKAAQPIVGDSAPPAFDAAPPALGGGSAPAASRAWDPAGTPQRVWQSLYQPPAPASATTPGAVSSSHAAAGAPPIPTRAVQMHNLYLVVEDEGGIMIIDQHALHERIIYEDLCRRITRGPLESQRLLLPETLNVSPQQAGVLEAHAELLQALGLEVTPFGRDAIAVHAVPVILKDADVPSFMRDLLDRLSDRAGDARSEELIHSILDMAACKAAVKAGDPLTDEEIRALVQRKELIHRASNCPHGRPTMLRLSRAELDRQFKRT